MEPPRWLLDEKEVLKLLVRLLDKTDKFKDPAATRAAEQIKYSEFPTLRRQDERADQLWELIKQLSPEVLTIREGSGNYDPPYAGARVALTPEGEVFLRRWFKRPRKTPGVLTWPQAVAQAADKFPGGIALLKRKIELKGRTPEQIVNAFAEIGNYKTQNLSLYQLSARCFWGDSKFLKNREAMVLGLFPDLKLKPRAVIINVFLPKQIEGILFVENQESYTGLIYEGQKNALIYCAGFRGGSSRIREQGGVSFHYQGYADQKEQFENWWYSDQWQQQYPGQHLQLCFWGDLDYSGMAILKSLKQLFPNIVAWNPGYEPMVNMLKSGGGHLPEQSKKSEQADPGHIGCNYADTVLLPLLRETERFVDQEMVG